jgi:hypothetical protein
MRKSIRSNPLEPAIAGWSLARIWRADLRTKKLHGRMRVRIEDLDRLR